MLHDQKLILSKHVAYLLDQVIGPHDFVLIIQFLFQGVTFLHLNIVKI